MRNEKLGTDTTALNFDFDAASGYADIKVTVAGVAVAGGLRIYANGTIAPPTHTTTTRNALANVVEGQLVTNETTNKLNVYLDGGWEEITSA